MLDAKKAPNRNILRGSDLDFEVEFCSGGAPKTARTMLWQLEASSLTLWRVLADRKTLC